MFSTALKAGSSIAVVGAGIVGVASALELSRRGYEVVVYDPCAPGESGPSKGNAGHIGVSDIFPLSTPGIHRKALRMLLSRNGALKIPLRDAPARLPWLWRFWRNSGQASFERATRALTYLCGRCVDDTRSLFRDANILHSLSSSGCLFFYDTPKSLYESRHSWALKAEAGFGSYQLASQTIAQELPFIASRYRHGIASRRWSMVSDPLDVVRALAQSAKAKGALFERKSVCGIHPKKGSVVVRCGTDEASYDAVVIAAGVHSVKLAAMAGDRLPIVAERGYNLTVPHCDVRDIELQYPLVFVDRGVVATNLTSGLRIGGLAEYAHHRRPASLSCFEQVRRISRELFPKIELNNAKYWMGNRPSVPDSVPVISRATHCENVYYNCGHGHYGLTHAATSAHIVSDLIEEDSSRSAYLPYSISRFN